MKHKTAYKYDFSFRCFCKPPCVYKVKSYTVFTKEKYPYVLPISDDG